MCCQALSGVKTRKYNRFPPKGISENNQNMKNVRGMVDKTTLGHATKGFSPSTLRKSGPKGTIKSMIYF